MGIFKRFVYYRYTYIHTYIHTYIFDEAGQSLVTQRAGVDIML